MNEATWKTPAAASAAVGVLAAVSILSCLAAGHAAANDKVFTVANYPVEATAKTAIDAKRKAITDGQQQAFRSLLKRLIPVTEYGSLSKLQKTDAKAFVASVAVRSEGEPTTRYIASLDYAFMPDRVRDLLRRSAVPFVDAQAPKLPLVLVYQAPTANGRRVPKDMSAQNGSALWLSVWRDLDLENALTPLAVTPVSGRIRPDVVTGAAKADGAALRILATEHAGATGGDRVVIAIAAPHPGTGRLNITLGGNDAVGPMAIEQSYPIQDGDLAYTMELAAVVIQGILEGRWKVLKARSVPGGVATPSAALQPVQVWVTYHSFAQWRSIQQVFYEIPGVTDLRIGGQSARSASIALRYPGGGGGLRAALAQRGLTLEQESGVWVLR